MNAVSFRFNQSRIGKKEKGPQTRSQQVDKLANQFKFIHINPTKRQQYVTVNFEFSLERLSPDDHLPEWREAKSSCVWCKYLIKKGQKKAARDPFQSQLYCIKCNVALCCNKNRSNCFIDYHTQVENDN
ncbi:hypothetical protein GLOIN_2v1789218 [Rhizophagus clarus]|uniref:Uncharacterized protein n=1 Tax=Rhizophagus clarus TaxID=94130 RepID=A0A8H3R960_9GLOM|nr:hypothetical protein GLOIN_2v1789218 [Rhizophagus clarus]